MCSVSVVVTVYNHEKFITEALDSILKQTRLPDQVVIIDDCSSDDTWSVIQQFIRNTSYALANNWVCLRNDDNKGVVESLNKAYRYVSSQCIVGLSGDDVMLPARIQQDLQALSRNEGCALVLGSVQPIDSVGRPLSKPICRPNSVIKSFERFLPDGHARLVPLGLTMRTEVWSKFGPLAGRICEDDQLIFRGILCGGVVTYERVNYLYRHHESQASAWKKRGACFSDYLSKIQKEDAVTRFLFAEWQRLVSIYSSCGDQVNENWSGQITAARVDYETFSQARNDFSTRLSIIFSSRVTKLRFVQISELVLGFWLYIRLRFLLRRVCLGSR